MRTIPKRQMVAEWKATAGSVGMWLLCVIAIMVGGRLLENAYFVESCAEHRPLVDCKADAKELFR